MNPCFHFGRRITSCYRIPALGIQTRAGRRPPTYEHEHARLGFRASELCQVRCCMPSGANGTSLQNLILATSSARACRLSFTFVTVALCLFSVVAFPRLPSGIEALKFLWDARLILCMSNVSERPRTSLTPISSEPLPDDPLKRITAMLVDFPPSAYSPEHHHEASLYVYILKGEIRSQLKGQPAQIFKAGDSFHEPEGSVHLFAENTSARESAQVLAVFVHKEGAMLTVFH